MMNFHHYWAYLMDYVFLPLSSWILYLLGWTLLILDHELEFYWLWDCLKAESLVLKSEGLMVVNVCFILSLISGGLTLKRIRMSVILAMIGFVVSPNVGWDTPPGPSDQMPTLRPSASQMPMNCKLSHKSRPAVSDHPEQPWASWWPNRGPRCPNSRPSYSS